MLHYLFSLAGSEYGGEGGIRTHVEAYAPHPISSRCRYSRFGTSPVWLNYMQSFFMFPLNYNPGGTKLISRVPVGYSLFETG